MKKVLVVSCLGSVVALMSSCVPVEDTGNHHSSRGAHHGNHDRNDHHGSHQGHGHNDRHSHGNHHNNTRQPNVRELSNGNYIVTFNGGGSASFNNKGNLLAKQGISSAEYAAAHRAVRHRARR